jgi:hypothetical protein
MEERNFRIARFPDWFGWIYVHDAVERRVRDMLACLIGPSDFGLKPWIAL